MRAVSGRVCIAASSGGHLEEALRLRCLRERHEHFWVTESVGGRVPELDAPVYAVPQLNRRDPLLPARLARAFLVSARAMSEQRPCAVVATGALATVPVMLIARMRGVPVVYVESAARVSSLSATGRLASRVASLLLTQWPACAEGVPGARCGGMLS